MGFFEFLVAVVGNAFTAVVEISRADDPGPLRTGIHHHLDHLPDVMNG
jgi:hypothetical protein